MEANSAFPLKTIHRLKDFWTVVGFDWRAVQLHEVERIDLKRLKAILDEWREICVGEQRRRLASAACRPILVATIGTLFPCFLRSLRMPAIRRSDVWSPIDVRRVEEIDALIETDSQSVQ